MEAQYDDMRYFELGPHATAEISSPNSDGATLKKTNIAVTVSVDITLVNTEESHTVIWSKSSGPGSVSLGSHTSRKPRPRFDARPIPFAF